MENLTHSLLGATLAEAVLPIGATDRQRAMFYGFGIAAANLPDADLLYTSITPAPLGYLLHHRGYTHTLGGLVALALLIAIVAALPGIRRTLAGIGGRFWTLVAAALASHVIADAWNSYGVHPFYPFGARWYYGDAVYIAEPWLWTLLGVSVGLNARRDRVRLGLSALLIAVPVAAAALHVIQFSIVAALGIAAALFVAVLRQRAPMARAWASLAAATVFVALSFGARGVARAEVLRRLDPSPDRRPIDIVMNPRPGNPLCWSALTLEDSAGSIVMRRGALTIVPGRLFSACEAPLAPDGTQSIAALRTAVAQDCWVAAWLQFGRVPILSNGWITDARFGEGRGNFTAMRVLPDWTRRSCPANLTPWDWPRADVLPTAMPTF
jgi:inner membrane protein